MRRLLCFGLALVLAVIVGRDAALAHWRSIGPDSVPGLLAGDAALRLRETDGLMTDLARLPVNAPAINKAAIEVLRSTPLNSSALRKLGVVANLSRPGAGQGLVGLAERVSRRDLDSELFLIDWADQQGNFAQTLRHYDHILMVYPDQKEKLFPPLASGLAEPEVRKALVTFASRPWLRDFVINAIDYDVAPTYLMDFYDDLSGKVSRPDLQDGSARIIKWLLTNNQSAFLGTFADRIPGVSPLAFNQLGFTATTLNPHLQPLSWQFLQSDAIDSEVEGQKMTVRVSPERADWVSLRMTWLKPGEYELIQTVSYFANSPRAHLEWHVNCQDSNKPPLLQQVLSLENAGTPVVARIKVPEGCPAQAWHLRATAAQSQFPSQAQIADLKLVSR